MTKRIVALLMALLMLAIGLASCGAKDENDRGAYISMYIADEVYDFDPANAYNNASALKVVSLLFSPLFANFGAAARDCAGFSRYGLRGVYESPHPRRCRQR